MNKRLYIAGKNSNEIYTIPYPQNIINFTRYDFTVFMERCIDICKLYMKTGNYNPDEVMQIRNSITGCHKYVEQNIRGIFDKLVIDCWIEYICRQNEIGIASLWNSFIPCKTDFERAVFTRLSEYRHNQAINQWVNLLKIQEYAQRKLDFIFSDRVKNASEAAAKSNYFDLVYNVVANELGYNVENIGITRSYTVGRIPNSPFIMSSASKEIVRNVLSELKYTEEPKSSSLQRSELLSDQVAMDAFSSVKAYIPTKTDNIVSTIIKSMGDAPQKVYMPCGFKSVIDLELDALIESGSVIQRCGRCREYYVRSAEYDYDYCDRVTREGRTCREIMSEKENRVRAALPDMAAVSARFDMLYKEMSERVNKEITQRDFSNWYRYMLMVKDNITSGKGNLADLDSFEEYSKAMNSSMAQPTVVEAAPQPSAKTKAEDETTETDEQGRKIKPFVFERIDRSELEAEPVRKPHSQKPQNSAKQSVSESDEISPVQDVSPAVDDVQTFRPSSGQASNIGNPAVQNPQNIQNMPNMPNMPNLQNAANMGGMNNIPNMANAANTANMQNIQNIQNIPNMASMQNMQGVNGITNMGNIGMQGISAAGAYPPPTRIIRGSAAINAPAYEQSFELPSGGVVIPNGDPIPSASPVSPVSAASSASFVQQVPQNAEGFKPFQPAEPVRSTEEKQDEREISAQAMQSIIDTPLKDDSAFDDDVKIYNIEKFIPQTPESDVKVYEPKSKKPKKKKVYGVVEPDAPAWEEPMKVVAENPTEVITGIPRAMREDAMFDAELIKPKREQPAPLGQPAQSSQANRSIYNTQPLPSLSDIIAPKPEKTSASIPPLEIPEPIIPISPISPISPINNTRPESRNTRVAAQYLSNTMPIDLNGLNELNEQNEQNELSEEPPVMPSFEKIKEQLEKPRSETKISLDTPKSATNTQEIDFNDILKGIERKDGFEEENIETDADGIPVSHKTKRVMETIFKQSKPSPFLNLGRDEDRKV